MEVGQLQGLALSAGVGVRVVGCVYEDASAFGYQMFSIDAPQLAKRHAFGQTFDQKLVRIVLIGQAERCRP